MNWILRIIFVPCLVLSANYSEITRGHERINKYFGYYDAVLKTDLMGELDKEVKSLEEDSWMFQGPRSRIHLISRRGYLLLSLIYSKQ